MVAFNTFSFQIVISRCSAQENPFVLTVWSNGRCAPSLLIVGIITPITVTTKGFRIKAIVTLLENYSVLLTNSSQSRKTRANACLALHWLRCQDYTHTHNTYHKIRIPLPVLIYDYWSPYTKFVKIHEPLYSVTWLKRADLLMTNRQTGWWRA